MTSSKFHLCCLAVFLLLSTTFGAEKIEEKLNAIRNLNIKNSIITSLTFSDSPTMTVGKGRTLKNLPPRVILKMTLNPAKGSNIKIEIWLPAADKWNGRFIGLGNGGSAGHINPMTLAWPFYSGAAVATTDMGTAPNSDSGIGNPEVWKDFGFRATHLMTVTAKEVIKSFYGKLPQYSYFNGGSTGGQQALQEAQRYPEDYDGIISNVPAHCRTPLHAYFLWNDQILNKCKFSDSQHKNVILAGNEYMAKKEIPQIAGKCVSDPRYDMKDIEAVIKIAREKDASLTDEHAEALKKLFDGPKHTETGERIFCGIPFGSSFNSARGHLYLFRWVFGKEKNLMDINFGADIDTYTSALAPYLNAENTDLREFKKRGGKLIMLSGTADSVVPYHATLDYYERVTETLGSLEKTQDFIKFYLVPGKDHGSNGPGITNLPNLLDMVIKWRENGEAPGKIQGKRIEKGKTVVDIPIYPYPSIVEWTESSGFKAVNGPRRGVYRVAERFRPPAKE